MNTKHEPSARVALVGRPNVGKSTLFNRLVRKRLALVYDQPGVTRDRLHADATFESSEWGEHRVELIDTAGVLGDTSTALAQASHEQTLLGVAEADLALLVVDGRGGVTPFDVEAARLLRRHACAFAVVVNKMDVGDDPASLADFYVLGGVHTVATSAEHARGIDSLHAVVLAELARQGKIAKPTQSHPDAVSDITSTAVVELEEPEELELDEAAGAGKAQEAIEWDGAPIRVAIVGRPNAGKSSLINAILHEDRMVASPEAGTTRDAIDSAYEHNGQEFVLVDTAGIRRSRRIDTRLEALSVSLAVRTMSEADVVVLLLNSTERPSEQDAKIAALAEARGKGLVLVASQWDKVENPEWREQFPKAVRYDLNFVSYAPLVETSAVTQRGIESLFEAIVQVQQERHRRIGTGALNRFFGEVVKGNPPPMRGGKRPLLSYVSQPMVKPPTFVFSTRRGASLDESYRRFLVRQLRRRYGFDGTPVWVKFRAQGNAKRDAAKS